MESLGGGRTPSRRGRKVFYLFVVAIGLLMTLRVGGDPTGSLTSDLPGIGPETRILATASFKAARSLRTDSAINCESPTPIESITKGSIAKIESSPCCPRKSQEFTPLASLNRLSGNRPHTYK